MGSTMTHQLSSPPALHHSFTRYSNTAGAPLPLIPRRLPSAGRSHSRPAHPETMAIKVHPPSPLNNPPTSKIVASLPEDVDASTSSLSDDHQPTVLPRSKRPRSLCLPGLLTPATHRNNSSRLGDESGQSSALYRSLESVVSYRRPPLVQRASDPPPLDRSVPDSSASDTSIPSTLQSPIVIPPNVEAKLIRKKSGQLVKSSLKSKKSQDMGHLSIITAGLSSKSEPATPTHTKAVHFDSCLERVKLFLAEQKPLAVSRDGSPTTDTSGTDNDFPSFIYGDSSDVETCDRLSMQVINMPPETNSSANVVLVDLKLSHDTMSIIGKVRVRNIAYQKWIAVRFTFDSWQTISEVTASHTRTLEGGAFDMFTFTIRLHDLFARIDDRTLILALRYTVKGREIWDNNGGKNYLARFTKTKTKRVCVETGESTSMSEVLDLQNRLESVMNGKESLLLRPASRRSLELPESNKPPGFKEASLSSRYNLTTSYRYSLKNTTLSGLSHQDAGSGFAASRNSIPWPPKPAPRSHRNSFSSPPQKKTSDALGSPREIRDDYFPPVANMDCEEDFPFHRSYSGRNHQRSYFDASFCDAGKLRRTPPGSPLVKSASENVSKPSLVNQVQPDVLTGNNIFHPALNQRSMGRRRDSGDSEGSMPSIVSPSSSSRSASPSPTETFVMNHLKGPDLDHHSPADSHTCYSQFLDKFCFYTGSENPLELTVPTAGPPARSLSASTIDTLPLSLKSRDLVRRFSPSLTPTRTQSFDEIIYRSDTSTPGC